MNDLLPTAAELEAFAPEIALVLAIAVVLLLPMFLKRKNLLAVAIAATAGLGLALLAALFTRGSAVVTPGVYFGGLLVHDAFSWAVKMMLIGFTCMVMALWFTDSHDKFITRRQAADAPEFFAMLLAATLGLCLMVCTTHLLMAYVALELASLPCCVLVGFRKGHRTAAAAGLKYFLIGGAASAVMLFGMSFLYGIFGTLDVAAMGVALAQGTVATSGSGGAALALGVVGLLAGMGFKIGMAPLHFGMVEALEGATMEVATFLSVAPVMAGLALLLRVIYALIGPDGATGPLAWVGVVLLIVGGATALWGNLGACRQVNIKKLLGWLTVGQAGYMLVGLAAVAAPAGPAHGNEGFAYPVYTSSAAEGLLFYLFLFLFMNAGAFIAAAAIAQRLTGPGDAGMSLGVDRMTPAAPPTEKSDAGTGEDLRQYVGLSQRAPILAATMLFFLLTLAGLPLTVGFAARMKLFTVLLETGSWIGWVGMGIIAGGSVIGAFACLRVIRRMYFGQSDGPRLIELAPVSVVALVLVIPNVAFFVAYGWVDHAAQRHAEMVAPRAAQAVDDAGGR